MELNRRRFCSAIAMSHSILPGTALAQNSIPISLNISSEVDANVDGVKLRFSHVDIDYRNTVIVPSGGKLDFTLEESGEYRVTLYNIKDRNKDIPLVYSSDNVTVNETGSSGSLTIPEAYEIDIRCVDPNGNPISRLPVSFRAPNGTGVSPGTFTTTEEGYVKYFEADETGIELAGQVDVEIQSPNESTETVFLETISVSQPREFEFVVSNPDIYTYNFQLIESDPDSGFYFPYYLYTPPAPQVTNSGDKIIDNVDPRPIVVGFNTWDSVSEREEKIADGRETIQDGRARNIADSLNTPAIVATLPISTEDHQFELLNRDALQISEPPYERLDLQIFAMIDDARQRLADQPYDIADKVQLDGFSDNGRLSDQLSILHPERINAVTGGGNGFHTIPKEKYEGDLPVQKEPDTTTLEWPVGTAGLADLVGRKFNKEAWLDTALYYYIGAEDQGNPDKSTLDNEYIHAKSYRQFGEKRQQLLVDIFGWKQVDERFETSRKIFDTVDATAKFRAYEGVGHSTPSRVDTDVIDFHRQQMVSEFGPQAGTNVQLRNIQLDNEPITADSSLHTLTFDVVNLSADSFSDSFSIEISDRVDLDSVHKIRVDDSNIDAKVKKSNNTIQFSLNPKNEQAAVDTHIEVDMYLSRSKNFQ